MRAALALILTLLAGPAFAQTQVVTPPPPPPPPIVQAPACFPPSFWNGVTCQVPAAPAIDPSWYYQQQLILQQQMQEQQRQEWRQREQWRQQHPEVPGGDHH